MLRRIIAALLGVASPSRAFLASSGLPGLYPPPEWVARRERAADAEAMRRMGEFLAERGEESTEEKEARRRQRAEERRQAFRNHAARRDLGYIDPEAVDAETARQGGSK